MGKYFDFTHHARLRRRHDGAPGRLARLQALARVPVRSGKYKSPFGLERLQSATAIPSWSAPCPPTSSPNRDVGISPRRARRGRRGLRGRGARRRARRRQRRRRHERRQGPRGPGVPSPFEKGQVGAQGPGLRRRGHHRQADGRPARLPLRRPGQRLHVRHRHHRRRHAHGATRRSSRSTRGPSACSPNTRGPARGSATSPATHVDFAFQGVADDGHVRPHRRGGDLRRRAAEEAVRSCEGPVGRPRARGARPRLRADDARVAAASPIPRKSRAQGLGLGASASTGI